MSPKLTSMTTAELDARHVAERVAFQVQLDAALEADVGDQEFNALMTLQRAMLDRHVAENRYHRMATTWHRCPGD